jgi:hypothetical protein
LPETLQGRNLRAARAVWILIAVVVTGLVMVGFGKAYVDPYLLSIPALTELFVDLNLGLRLMISIALFGPFVAVVIVSLIVFRRRSDDPMALLLTSALLVFYAYLTRSLLVYEGIPLLGSAVSLTFTVGTVLVLLTLGLFPNGVFVPRWTGWLAPAMIVLLIWAPDAGAVLMNVIGQSTTTLTVQTAVLAYGLGVLLVLGLLAQSVRYRTVSTAIERQQAKWAIAPFGLWLTMTMAALILSVAFPDPSNRTTSWVILLSIPLNFLIPVSLAIAVSKYHLYEIDRIISRTLGYVLVIGFLVAAYSVGAVLLPTRFGGDSPLFVAGSTLAIAAMFNPVRRRVLRWVDRRFYRSRYDAKQVVEDFSVRLRDQIDIDVLTEDWVAVVRETMQPSSIGAWVKVDAQPTRR